MVSASPKFKADGLQERATSQEIYGDEYKDDEDVDLYYYVPGQEEDAAWEPAVRPKLPLRNT